MASRITLGIHEISEIRLWPISISEIMHYGCYWLRKLRRDRTAATAKCGACTPRLPDLRSVRKWLELWKGARDYGTKKAYCFGRTL